MNIGVNILNVLKVRKPNDRVNWDPLLVNKVIPYSYKLFLETFNVFTYSDSRFYQYYSNEFNTITNFGIFDLDFENNLIIDNLFDVPIINNVLESISKSDDEVIKESMEGFLPIGITPLNDYLIVGTIGSNSDKIFIQSSNTNLFLSENIFEFCRHIYLIPESNRWLPDLSKLYRNWEEDFWRISE